MWLAGTSLIVFCLFGSLFGGLFDRVFQNRTAATIFVFALAVAFAFVQFKLFTGDIQKQGRLEYEYREHLFARGQQTTLYQLLKTAPLPSPSTFPEKYERLIGQPQADDNAAIYAYAKLAEGAFKDLDFEKAAAYLLKALSKAGCSAVINARLAKTYERMGLSEEAVHHYKAAMKDTLNSSQLNAFLESEALRVRAKGPDEYDWRASLHRM